MTIGATLHFHRVKEVRVQRCRKDEDNWIDIVLVAEDGTEQEVTVFGINNHRPRVIVGPVEAASGDTVSHTPGPWHYTTMRIETRRRDIGAANGANVAEVIEDAGYDETLANARLIAAAPELLEVCKKFIACLGPDGYYTAAGEPVTDEMRAAIAKAEGRDA